MSVGFEFKLNKLDVNILKVLFGGFNLEKYRWYIYNEQAWDTDSKELFDSGIYTGDQLKELLKRQPSLVMLITIYGYNGEFPQINTFKDYLESDCQCAVYIVDAAYIEVYCKNVADLELLLGNAKKLNISELIYIEKDNVQRTVF